MLEARTWAANDDEGSPGSSAISENIVDVEQRYVGVNLRHTHAEAIILRDCVTQPTNIRFAKAIKKAKIRMNLSLYRKMLQLSKA